MRGCAFRQDRPAATCPDRNGHPGRPAAEVPVGLDDRVARGELRARPTRPQARTQRCRHRARLVEHNHPHDPSGTDRRNPTVNGYGLLYGSPELSTDEFDTDPNQHGDHVPCRCATRTRHDP
jgi:hypothetical protein